MRNEAGRAGDDLKEVHPLGKSPTIGITPAGSDKEIIVTESETIVEYICEHFGKQLIPKRYPEGKEGVLGAETDEWMRYKVCPYMRLVMKQPANHALVPYGLRRGLTFHCSDCGINHGQYVDRG